MRSRRARPERWRENWKKKRLWLHYNPGRKYCEVLSLFVTPWLNFFQDILFIFTEPAFYIFIGYDFVIPQCEKRNLRLQLICIFLNAGLKGIVFLKQLLSHKTITKDIDKTKPNSDSKSYHREGEFYSHQRASFEKIKTAWSSPTVPLYRKESKSRAGTRAWIEAFFPQVFFNPCNAIQGSLGFWISRERWEEKINVYLPCPTPTI